VTVISAHNPTAVGLLGGTFDPIHLGHLRLGWEALTQLKLDQLRLMPCHIPPHRDDPAGQADHRLAMAKLACESVPGFVVDDWEILRDSPSYSVETLKHVRQQIGAQTPLIFIMGMDAYRHFTHWHQWQEILTIAHLWVAHRPGSPPPEEHSQEAELLTQHCAPTVNELLQHPAGRIHIYSSTALDISATVLRSDINNGIEPRFLLPDAVWQYIQDHKLYGYAD